MVRRTEPEAGSGRLKLLRKNQANNLVDKPKCVGCTIDGEMTFLDIKKSYRDLALLALESVIYVAPDMPTLSFDELHKIGASVSRAGIDPLLEALRQLEKDDAIEALGDKYLLRGEYHPFLIFEIGRLDPEYRHTKSLDYVMTYLARKWEGGHAPAASPEELIDASSKCKATPEQMLASIRILLMKSWLKQEDGRLVATEKGIERPAPSELMSSALPGLQHIQRSRAQMPLIFEHTKLLVDSRLARLSTFSAEPFKPQLLPENATPARGVKEAPPSPTTGSKVEFMSNNEAPTRSPKVFISYSYDGPEHEAWVLKLAEDLRQDMGVDVTLDQWEKLGADLPHFMEQSVTSSDRVILVCSEKYAQKANAGKGGAGYEKMLVARELASDSTVPKFIPIVRNNANNIIPVFIGSKNRLDFSSEDDYAKNLEKLARDIHDAPQKPKPAIGPNPFAKREDAKKESNSPRRFDSEWFGRHSSAAIAKAASLGYATMEVRFGIRNEALSVEPRRLLEAAMIAPVPTFVGWPFGIFKHDDDKPKPSGKDSIVTILTKNARGPCLDYWALRSSGDFYLLRSLLEDLREPGSNFISHDTRIWQTAEALMYCRNLYTALGLAAGQEVDIQTTYRGMSGRKIVHSGPEDRILYPFLKGPSHEDTAEGQSSFEHPASNERITETTQALLEPLFAIFDFFQPSADVYKKFAGRFLRGICP
jgi:TIR domain